jgi:Zn ribbon nucleic-acid-binding protein
MVWRFKGCPHCGGDTFLVRDIDNILVENCLQCGYEAYKNEGAEKPPAGKPLKRRYNRQLVQSR